MNFFFYRSAKFLKVVPLKMLIQVSGQKVVLPFYHTVADSDLVHIKHLYKVRTTKEFEKDLDFLTRYFIPTDAKTFLAKLENKEPVKANSLILTFDDGLREFHDVVAPLLLRKGIPATCFLNSGFIDNRDMFFRYKASILADKLILLTNDLLKKKVEKWFIQKHLPFSNPIGTILSINYQNRSLLDELATELDVDFKEFLDKYKPYMSSHQVSSLIDQGFTFGAHSIDHPQYADLPLHDQIMQTRTSLDDIASKFNLTYKYFSFPFTDFGVSGQFFETIYNSQIADLSFGCAGLKSDGVSRNMQRIPMEVNKFTAQEIIYGEYFYYLFKALLNKNVIRRD